MPAPASCSWCATSPTWCRPTRRTRNYHGVSAAVEYAVKVLKVRNIVVLGHARCGGIQAFADNAPPGDFIGRWMSLVAPAAKEIESREEAPGSYLTRLEQASVVLSIDNLMTFPYVRIGLRARRARAARRLFQRVTGELEVLDRETGVSWGWRRIRRASATVTDEMDAANSISSLSLGRGSPPALAHQTTYAALRLASISLRLIRHSAIWIALSAAPLRRLSETTHSTRPLSTVGSVRMRLI